MAAAAEVGERKGKGRCGAAARVYCGADDATLCWGCDAQVHGVNFLVARHARALLCRGCAQPTPLRAAGPRLGPTASICERCVCGGVLGAEGVARGGEEGQEEDAEEMVVEEEGENQVVPWAGDADATPQPVASSTSSSSREAAPNASSPPRLSHHRASPARHRASPVRHRGRSDDATSSRNGGRFFSSRHRKRSSLSDFVSAVSAQSGSSAAPRRNRSSAVLSRNKFS